MKSTVLIFLRIIHFNKRKRKISIKLYKKISKIILNNKLIEDSIIINIFAKQFLIW
jgi:hypothetical protein